MQYLNLSGTVELQASKSILNRVLIIASMVENEIEIINFSDCEDINTMLKNLSKIGLIRKKNSNRIFKFSENPYTEIELNIKDSGTAARFLLARSCILEGKEIKIEVSEQLKQRPIKDLIYYLKELGSKISGNHFPIKIIGDEIHGGYLEVDGDISSQFISALLLISPAMKNGLHLKINGKIVSQNYIKMTIKIMRRFGINVEYKNDEIIVNEGQKYKNPEKIFIEPDFSSACYFWAMGALSKEGVSVKTNVKKSLQPDFSFLKVLKQMGAEIVKRKDDICVKANKLNGVEVDMKDMPDQVMTLAVLALFARGKTIIKNVGHLKFKESNRIENLVAELKKINAHVSAENGTIEIYPHQKYIRDKNIVLNCHSDHRFVMAFSILKYFFQNLELNETEAVKKSFPDFFIKLKELQNSDNHYMSYFFSL